MSNNDLSSHKLPPQNLEAEQSILGGILIDNEAINIVLEILTPEDFYRESHKKIFDCMIDLSEKGHPADLITLTDLLKKKDILDEVGGVSYVAYLVDSVPTAANIKVYARIVKEKAILRKLISTATDIATKCYEAEGDVDEFLDHAEKVIFEISENKIRPSFYAMRDIVKDSFKTIERLYERKELVTGVPTGFKDLDKITSGLQPADLIIVAGRPSMGKTALCLNMAQHAAIEGKFPVAVFSLEMSKESLLTRMLCASARVDSHKFRLGFLDSEERRRLQPAQRRVGKVPFPGVEAKSLVDHHRLPARTPRLEVEYRLASVGVAGPLVEDQHPAKIAQIFHLPQRIVRQEIVHHRPRRISRKTRPQLPARLARRPAHAQLHHQVRGQSDQFLRHLHHFDPRHRQSQPRRQPGSQHFVGQHPHMLRIVLKFYDVAGVVITTHQVRLRAAAHAADVLYCQRHGTACYAPYRIGSSGLLR